MVGICFSLFELCVMVVFVFCLVLMGVGVYEFGLVVLVLIVLSIFYDKWFLCYVNFVGCIGECGECLYIKDYFFLLNGIMVMICLRFGEGRVFIELGCC